MMPVNKYTEPSYQMPVKQVPFMQCHVPSTKTAPVESETPIVYQPWPYYSHNVPYSALCHSCFSHRNSPGYYGFRPPFLYHSPHPCSSCGYHPHAPETIPVQYVYPSPPYVMQQPICDYQRGFPKDYHCCGCPNHTHDQILREGSRVKVEEQVTGADKGRDSLVPLRSSNNGIPIVWIPNEHTKKEEKMQPNGRDLVSEDRAPREMEQSKDLKQSEREQGVSNGWIPFDVEGLKSLMMGEDASKNQNEVNGSKWGHFPFPIIWLPSFDKQDVAAKEDQRMENSAKQTSEHSSAAHSLFPVKLPDSGNSLMDSQGVKESQHRKAGSESKEKKTDPRQIPVKQMDQHGEKGGPVKVDDSRNEEGHVAVKTSGASSKRQSSPPKSSKLPPVCLRVDPLAMKKTGNGTSRSPSPPKSKVIASEPGLTNGQDSKIPLTDNEEVDTKRKEISVFEVVDGMKTAERDDREKAGLGTHLPEVVLADEDIIHTKEDKPRKEVDSHAVEDKDTNETTVSETSTENGTGTNKLSSEEAALLIQSAYRGYTVRRWEPLKKLKQIANIREQVADVRNRINALESYDFREDDKQILMVGEMTMGLLLKLDTVQGLHPSLRDIRKSLARELVSLQEKLDSLDVAKSKEMANDKPCACPELDAGDMVSLQFGKNIQTTELPRCDSFKDQWGQFPKPLQADDDLIIVEGDSKDAKVTSDVATSTEEANTDACLGEFNSGQVLVTGNQHGRCFLSDAEVLKVHEDCSSVQNIKETILSDDVGGHSWNGQWKDDGVAEYVGMENYELKELPQGSVDQNSDQLKPAEEEKTELRPIGETNPAALDIQMDTTLEDSAAHTKEENIETETPVPTKWTESEQNLHADLAFPATAIGSMETDQEILKENLIVEVLPGEPDMDEQTKCDMSERLKHEVPCHNNAVVPIFEKVKHPSDVINGGSSVNKAELELEPVYDRLETPEHVDVPHFVEVQEQPVDVFEGSFFADERIDCKEIGTEDPEPAMPEEAVKQAELVEVDLEDKHLEDVEPEKMLQEMLDKQNETDNETSGGDDATVEMQCDSQVKEPMSREVHIDDEPGVNSKDADWRQKAQQHQLEIVSGNGDNWENNLNGSENKEMMVPSNKMNVEVVTNETDLSTGSSISKQLSVDDDKLVEENRKLREMMEKLKEAGQQQLTVISNLAGRVQDLERKLLQKKRRKARRCRRATFNNNRAVEV